MKTLFAVGALLLSGVNGDVYMQACRGSNNRLDERGRDRANGNRLFDSQNNNRGGYNVGKLSYYPGEKVRLSWTNQHGSGPYQLNGTELILQYACDALMRDGTTTNTIPDNPKNCYNYDCDTDLEYGRHESFTSYQYCKAASRNMGLFTANQNLNNKNGAIYTRQNPGGTRRGLECPEERDYYPYWRGSMWRDIHIFTNEVDRCPAYVEETQNVKNREECVFKDEYWKYYLKGYYRGRRGILPIDMEQCTETAAAEKGHTYVSMENDNATVAMYEPRTIPAHGIDAPSCSQATVTRANHHGLTGGRHYYYHEWTVPDLSADEMYNAEDYETCCVVRLRYNITTDEYDAWESITSIGAGLNYMNNSQIQNPNADDDPAWVTIWEKYGLEYSDVSVAFGDPDATGTASNQVDADDEDLRAGRGYVFRNNPRVAPFGLGTFDDDGTDARIQLQLAINTNQFARTFQDRTHCFQIKPRPEGMADSAEITLLTVQGKRGNIVQVYPATEYFFVPEPLMVSQGNYVHFCWTGSNTNPNNNDGQGLQGTDRSNICPSAAENYPKDMYSNNDGNVAQFENGAVGDLGNNYPAYVEEPDYGIADMEDFGQERDVAASNMAGMDMQILKSLCIGRRIEAEELLDFGSMEELDDAGTTFCIEPVRVTESGLWNFLCTRNNNFSNRSQKGSMTVFEGGVVTGAFDSRGGSLSGGKGEAALIVPEGMVEEGDTLEIQLTTWARPGKDSPIVQLSGPDLGTFNDEILTGKGWLELWIPFTPSTMSVPYVSYSSDGDSFKEEDEATVSEDRGTSYAVYNVKDGGYYKADNKAGPWAIVTLCVAGLSMCVAGGFLVMNKCK